MKPKFIIFISFILLLTLPVSATTYTCCHDYRTSYGKIYEQFENLSEWNSVSTGSSYAVLDTVNYRDGNAGLKLVSVAGTSAIYYKNISMSVAPNNMVFDFWMYVEPDDLVNISQFFVVLSNDGAFTKYYLRTIGVGTSLPQNDFIAGWNHYSFNISDMTQSGSPNTSVLKMRFRMTPVTGKSVNVTLDSLSINATGRAKVILTFDDDYSNQSTLAFPVMQSNNQKGVAAIVTGWVGQTNYMNTTQLNELYAAGWDISPHTKNHINLSGATVSNATSEIIDSKTTLSGLGFTRGNNIFVYPGGQYINYNDTILDIVKANFLLGRSNQRGYSQPHLNGSDDGNNTVLLRTLSVYNTVTPSTVYAQINTTINNSGLLILVFHDIINQSSTGVSTEYTISNFTNISNYLASRSADIDVITFGDYLNEIPTPLSASNPLGDFATNFLVVIIIIALVGNILRDKIIFNNYISPVLVKIIALIVVLYLLSVIL